VASNTRACFSRMPAAIRTPHRPPPIATPSVPAVPVVAVGPVRALPEPAVLALLDGVQEVLAHLVVQASPQAPCRRPTSTPVSMRRTGWWALRAPHNVGFGQRAFLLFPDDLFQLCLVPVLHGVCEGIPRRPTMPRHAGSLSAAAARKPVARCYTYRPSWPRPPCCAGCPSTGLFSRTCARC